MTDRSWVYARQRNGPDFEYAQWDGSAPPLLGMHFHDENQFAIVIEGSRVFQLRSEIVQVTASQCLFVPAGMPHRSLPSARARCFNLYVPGGDGLRQPVVFQLPDLGLRSGSVSEADVARLVAEVGRHGSARDADGRVGDDFACHASWDDRASIGEIASRLGVSREAFTRAFGRRTGMPPNAFRIVGRLNAARGQIRAGVSIAGAAADCGFADQSHLGRHFRRVFGVTPRAYLDAMR